MGARDEVTSPLGATHPDYPREGGCARGRNEQALSKNLPRRHARARRTRPP